MDVSKIAAGHIELQPIEISIAPFCDNVVDSLASLAEGKSLVIEREYDDLQQSVWADPKRLQQILVNLLGNALKFTSKGSVGIRTRAGDADSLWIEIWDEGIGISEDDCKLLFEPFVQVDGSLDRSYGGTGLGLALTKSLVEAHGGSIRVTSQLGEGSQFVVALPVRAPALRSAASGDVPHILDETTTS